MLELDHLTVSGDVTFGKNVSLKVILKEGTVFCPVIGLRPTVFEPRYEKTGFLHMRKQRRRSALR